MARPQRPAAHQRGHEPAAAALGDDPPPADAVHRLRGHDHPVRVRGRRDHRQRRLARWVDLIDRDTVFAWLFLGIGIGLGAVWAYVVLGWGGYWAWDPVENASLLPWLTGVGLLHSFTVYRRRDGFKKWAISLAAVTLRARHPRHVHHALRHRAVGPRVREGPVLALPVPVHDPRLARRDRRRHAAGAARRSRATTSSSRSPEGSGVLLQQRAHAGRRAPRRVPHRQLGAAEVPARRRPDFSAATYDAVARPVGILYVFILASARCSSWRKTDGATLWAARHAGRSSRPRSSRCLLLWEWYRNLRPIYAAQNPTRCRSAAGVPQHRGDHRPHRRRVRDLDRGVPVHRRRPQACRRRAARASARAVADHVQGAQPVRRLHHPPRHRHHPDRPGRLGDVRARHQDPGPSDAGCECRGGRATPSCSRRSRTTRCPTATRRPRRIFDVKPRRQDGRHPHAGPARVRRPGPDAPERERGLGAAARRLRVSRRASRTSQLALNVKINPLIWFTWIGFAILLMGTTIALWPRGAKARELATSDAPLGRSKGAKTKAAVG